MSSVPVNSTNAPTGPVSTAPTTAGQPANVAATTTTTTPATIVTTAPRAVLPTPAIGGGMAVTASMMAVINARNANIAKRSARFEQVSAAIVAPPTTAASTRTTENGTVDVFIVPTLPPTATMMERRHWALYLASGLKSVNAYSERAMAVQIIAFFHVIYPELVAKSHPHEWMPYVLTAQQVAMLGVFYRDGLALPGKSASIAVQKTALNAIRAQVTIPHTLGIKSITQDFFNTELDWVMFHGYAGLLLFTMHKITTTASSQALMVARPLALCRKYARENGSYSLWVESGRPSQTAFAACTTIWKLIPATRYNLMFEFAHSSIGQISAEREALFTTVRLMQWTDLSHIPIINEALSSFDMLKACPHLQGEIAAYQAGIIQLVEMMPPARDTNRNAILDANGEPTRDLTTMPYVKALWGDRKTIAQRGTMPVLLGIALDLLKPTKISLRTYTGPAGFSNNITEVRDWFDAASDASRNL